MEYKRLKRFYTEKLDRVNNFLKRIIIPGSAGMSLYTLATYFRYGIGSVSLNMRASAISFKLFMAIFPGIIFFFTIIPHIPVADFHPTLMLTLKDLLPEGIFPVIERTISDIILIKHTGLLSFGFIMAFYFSSSGFISLISAFNHSANITETMTEFQQRLIGILLTFISTLIIIIAVSMMAIGHDSLDWLISKGVIGDQSIYSVLLFGRWFILAAMIYFTISMIYYIAPARKAGFRFFSAGSLIATLFFLGIAWGFGYFIQYFSSYNALYGTVGTLLLLMLYIYYNAVILLVGFELNASFNAVKRKNRHLPQDVPPDVV